MGRKKDRKNRGWGRDGEKLHIHTRTHAHIHHSHICVYSLSPFLRV